MSKIFLHMRKERKRGKQEDRKRGKRGKRGNQALKNYDVAEKNKGFC